MLRQLYPNPRCENAFCYLSLCKKSLQDVVSEYYIYITFDLSKTLSCVKELA